MKKMLNLGCGNTFHSQWVNIDMVSYHPSVLAYDVRKSIPFHSDFFNCVYTSHLLEHLTKQEGEFVLNEAYRVLKKHGVIRLVIPDLEVIATLYLKYLHQGWKNLEKNDTVIFHKYNWMKTELLDQLVRETNGGNMKICIQTYRDIHAFIQGRIGQEAEAVKTSRSLRSLFKIPISSYKERVRYALFLFLSFLFGGRKYVNMVKVGYFRGSGEVHKTMYDKYDVYMVLKKIGFRSITVKTATTSTIPNFGSYELDVVNGKIRKPDSLYIEAIK